MRIKELLKKFWFLVWKDDSFKGWVFSLIFLFVFIKLIFFPLLSLVTGTELPLAIVESCSMYHKGVFFSDFDKWWQTHEQKYIPFVINDLDFKEFNFKNGFNKGDILFIVGANPENLKVGDLIIFNGGQRNPIIHRIVKIEMENEQRIFSTMGDNNNGQLSIEKRITEEQIIGKANFMVVPYLGWIKLIFFDVTKPESERGFCEEH